MLSPGFNGHSKAGAYDEIIAETDHHVGRILEFLDRSGIAAHTLVILTSDNGPENTWMKRKEIYNHPSYGIYLDGKRSVYEGCHRVPFLVRWPDGIRAPGRDCNWIVIQSDLLATFAVLLGMTLPENAGEDSYSFFEVFQDPNSDISRVPAIHHSMNGRFAIRQGRWKLLMEHGGNPMELYNLFSDTGEEVNQIGTYPEIAAMLTGKVTTIVRDGRSTAGDPRPNDTGWWEDLT